MTHVIASGCPTPVFPIQPRAAACALVVSGGERARVAGARRWRPFGSRRRLALSGLEQDYTPRSTVVSRWHRSARLTRLQADRCGCGHRDILDAGNDLADRSTRPDRRWHVGRLLPRNRPVSRLHWHIAGTQLRVGDCELNSLRLLRPVRAGGDLVAHGTPVHAGRSLGLSHVRITPRAAGNSLQTEAGCCFIRPSAPAGSPRRPHHSAGRRPDSAVVPNRSQGDGLRSVGSRSRTVESRSADWRCSSASAPAANFPIPRFTLCLTGCAGVAEVDKHGEAVFALPAHQSVLGGPGGGTVQGGVARDARRHRAGMRHASRRHPREQPVRPAMDLKVNYLRPALADGRELVARGRVRPHGSYPWVLRPNPEVTNADGKAVALATGSAMLPRRWCGRSGRSG